MVAGPGSLAAAALLVAGFGPAGWWRPVVAVGAVGSVLLLAVFFHPWIVLDFGIDGLLL